MQLMIDIETLATTKDACIIQIGLYPFAISKEGDDDLKNGVFTSLTMDVSVTEQIELGRAISEKTVSWWMDTTSPEARENVLSRYDLIPFGDAIKAFNDYVYDIKNGSRLEKFGIWGNSPSFDLEIMRHAVTSLGMKPSWSYAEEYDVRTIRMLNTKLELGVTYDKSHPLAHDAGYDAGMQGNFVTSVFNKLRNKPYTESMTFHRGTKVIFRNKVYEFGYMGQTGKAIIFEEVGYSIQDAIAVDPDELRIAPPTESNK